MDTAGILVSDAAVAAITFTNDEREKSMGFHGQAKCVQSVTRDSIQRTCPSGGGVPGTFPSCPGPPKQTMFAARRTPRARARTSDGLLKWAIVPLWLSCQAAQYKRAGWAAQSLRSDPPSLRSDPPSESTSSVSHCHKHTMSSKQDLKALQKVFNNQAWIRNHSLEPVVGHPLCPAGAETHGICGLSCFTAFVKESATEGEEGKWECRFEACRGSRVTSLEDAIRHVRYLHFDHRPFVCTQCAGRFHAPIDLANHQQHCP